MYVITGVSFCRRTLLAVVGALVCVAPCNATLVAHYTFDDADTTVTGVGTMGDPYQLDLADASGNGNTAYNTSTELSQPPPWGWPEIAHYGNATITGEPGVIGESHRFFRDPSVFQTSGGGGTAKEQANTIYYVDAAAGTDAGSNGDIPDGADPRSFSLWFNEEVDLQAYTGSPQNKLFGYGDQFGGEAFDIGLRDGGIQLRHFGGSINWGSGYEFYQYRVDFDGDVIPGVGADAGWHHLVVRVNDSATDFNDVDVFLDNSQLSVASSTAGALTTPIFTTENIDGFGIGSTSISAFGAAANGLQGWLDQFRIYDHALNAQEIEDLYNEPNLVVAGDYNGDGIIDGADYTVWRDTEGDSVPVGTGADGSGPGGVPDGVIDQYDFDIWVTNFGEIVPTGAGTGSAAVPEPSALRLGMLLAIAAGIFGRRGIGGRRRDVEMLR